MYKVYKRINENTLDIQYIKNKKDKIDSVNLTLNAFSKNKSDEKEIIKDLNLDVNFDISIVAKLNNLVIGCYLVGENNIYDYYLKTPEYFLEDMTKYKNKKGLEGISLIVKPDFQKTGIGNILRRFYENKGYDYIWGQQYKYLNNKDNWIRFGRRLVYEDDDIIFTLKDITN